MPQDSYVVPGWPSRVYGHSAVTPNLARAAGGGSMQYKDGVSGHPGTKQVPVGSNTTPSPDAGDKATMGLSRWQDAPPFILPNLYYARPQRQFWPGGGQPVSVMSDNLMPVPATDPRGIPARLAFPVNQRGARNLAQPARVVTWPGG